MVKGLKNYKGTVNRPASL